jgi:Flp pilus assembly pilin Flp
MRSPRRGQTTVEYMMTISVITIAIMAVVYTFMTVIYDETGALGTSLATSLTTDGIQ